MNKKILIGSIIAVAILVMMPSIPAVHVNTIQNEIELKNDVKGFPEIPERFPLLFLFVIGIAYFRIIRMLLWMEYSFEFDDNFPGRFKVIHPLGAIRAAMLLLTTDSWLMVWDGISNRFGWDWDFIN